MNCEYCGSPLEYEVNSCTRCGAPCKYIPKPQGEQSVVVIEKVNEEQSDPVEKMATPNLDFIQQGRKQRERESKDALKVLMIIGAVILAVIVLASC